MKKRVIIAGGRDFGDADAMRWILGNLRASYGHELVILQGDAKGADTLAKDMGREFGMTVECYPADWDQYGKAAGALRNQQMAANADILVAFWDGESKGTKHMIDTALRAGLEVHVYPYNRSKT